jgi:hypothetical protein
MPRYDDYDDYKHCQTCQGRAKPLNEVPSGRVYMCTGCGGWLSGGDPMIPQNGDCPSCHSPAKNVRKLIPLDADGRSSQLCCDNWHWTGNQLVAYSDGEKAPRGWEWNEGDTRFMREMNEAFAKPL